MYNDTTTARRLNILSEINPQQIGLLEDKGILPVAESFYSAFSDPEKDRGPIINLKNLNEVPFEIYFLKIIFRFGGLQHQTHH